MSLWVYCLLGVERGTAKQVLDEVAQLDGLIHANLMLGEYDIIAYFCVNSSDELKPFGLRKITREPKHCPHSYHRDFGET